MNMNRIVLEKSFKYDHQAFEEHVSVHLSIIIVLHCIMFWSILQRHYWRFRATDIYNFICGTVTKISLVYITKHHNFITFCSHRYQHLHQIAYFCSVWALIILTISDLISQKGLLYQINTGAVILTSVWDSNHTLSFIPESLYGN